MTEPIKAAFPCPHGQYWSHEYKTKTTRTQYARYERCPGGTIHLLRRPDWWDDNSPVAGLLDQVWIEVMPDA